MIERLFGFIKKSPTAFHTVDTVKKDLCLVGFEELKECDEWNINRGGSYFVTRNGSSIIAFKIGKKEDIMPFRIAASHGDSPMFKLKENSELTVRDRYVQLNTEGYGGMICSTWMDRPLSLAGRVIIKEDGALKQMLFAPDTDMVLIPSLAIHMNRKVNEGVELNKQVDMLPLYAQKENSKGVSNLIANYCSVDAECIYGKDIFVYNRMNGSLWGENKEFISAPRLDDLMCAFASFEGFKESRNDGVISIYACFDNEEVGSDTLQGAGSSFLEDVLERITVALGYDKTMYHRALSESLMLSEDNGHALHPNHPEKTDATNFVLMNAGIVIKSHAGQKYASDAIGVAICRDIAKENNIPVQYFSNRSDEAGGSTLGNIAACRVPIKTVDIGLAQLAMHSAYETAGAKDVVYMEEFNRAFFEYDGNYTDELPEAGFCKMADGSTKYRCACCGEYTLSEGRGKHEICPVCDWEDDRVQNDDIDFSGGANRMSLREAREKYLASQAED